MLMSVILVVEGKNKGKVCIFELSFLWMEEDCKNVRFIPFGHLVFSIMPLYHTDV